LAATLVMDAFGFLLIEVFHLSRSGGLGWRCLRFVLFFVVSQVDFELFGFLMIGVAMAFGLSQWLSQWSKSTLIAFCIAPVLTIFSFMYVVFLHEYINSPWWLLVGSIGISFAATRIMLRPWMDGRTGLRYWLTQGALLTGVLALPLVPFLFTYATYPGMPTAMRQELTEEAKRYEPFDQGIAKPKTSSLGLVSQLALQSWLSTGN